MHTAATYLPTEHWHLQKSFIQWSYKVIISVAIYDFFCVYTLFQNYILLKDSLNFPCITIKNDLLS